MKFSTQKLTQKCHLKMKAYFYDPFLCVAWYDFKRLIFFWKAKSKVLHKIKELSRIGSYKIIKTTH